MYMEDLCFLANIDSRLRGNDDAQSVLFWLMFAAPAWAQLPVD